jgi:hypothetical protein
LTRLAAAKGFQSLSLAIGGEVTDPEALAVAAMLSPPTVVGLLAL